MKDNISFALSQINTQGGHIVLLSAFTILGVMMVACKIPKGEDVVVGAMSGLFVALRPSKE